MMINIVVISMIVITIFGFPLYLLDDSIEILTHVVILNRLENEWIPHHSRYIDIGVMAESGGRKKEAQRNAESPGVVSFRQN